MGSEYDVWDALEAGELDKAVRGLVAELSQLHREAIELYYFQGYTVVEAPAGAEVQQLPEQTINVNVEGDTYQYANGAYYQEKEPEKEGEEPSFEVVEPPAGATVQNIPEDAKKQKVGDEDYFVYGSTWYKPFYSGSDVVYMVVPKPDGAAA